MNGELPALLGVERSLTGKRWRPRSGDERLALALAQRLNVPEIIGRILAGRGVGAEEADRFLNPSLRAWLPDPSAFLDMDRAAARVARAVLNGERIAIFGDYDVDGATSTALLHRFLSSVGAPPLIHIPDRITEGYGPNAPALLRLRDNGAKVVLTVDCGTMAHAPLKAAAEAGLDVVVVDHHQAEPALPTAFAVVNPNRLDESAGHRQLAAVGVAFLLAVAVNRDLRAAGHYTGERTEPDLRQWLDLVAVGTVADVVPLTGVNRALVAYGLKVLGERRNAGLAALADVAGLNEPPGAYHAGFMLGPRINAGGRVGRADLGARLLTNDDAAECAALAQELNQLNRERQTIEAEVLAEAQGLAARAGEAAGGHPPLVLVAGEGWHPGVIGIVAARVREMTDRPTFIIALDAQGVGKGSGRSVPGVDLGAAVTAAGQAGLLMNGGGHAMAAGLTVRAERVGELHAFLNQRIAAQMADAAASGPSLGLDGALAVHGANADLYDLLERAGPYGAGNAEPRFALPGVRVVKADIRGERHVRCILSGADGRGRLNAIAFRSVEGPLGPALLNAVGGGLLHVAGHLRASWYRGERRLELVVEDAAAA